MACLTVALFQKNYKQNWANLDLSTCVRFLLKSQSTLEIKADLIAKNEWIQ